MGLRVPNISAQDAARKRREERLQAEYESQLSSDEANKRAFQESRDASSGSDFVDAPTTSPIPASSTDTGQRDLATQMAVGGGGMGALGGAGSGAGIASLMGVAPGYGAAAGAGLAVLAAREKRKDDQKKLEYQAKQNQLERTQRAISQLANISSSLRNL